jgi:hypothetical protein
MAGKRVLIEDWQAFKGFGNIWFRNRGVGQSGNIEAIGTVNIDAAFACSRSVPLKGNQGKAGNKSIEEAWEVDVKQCFLFFHELRLDSITACFHSQMVIVNVSAWNLRGRRGEVTSKWNPFGAYLKGSGIVRRRVVHR